MIRRLINNRGAVHIAIIIVVVAVVAVAAVVVGFLTDGFGVGGGKGDSEGAGNVSAVQGELEITEPTVEELDFLNVTVSENEYLYQNSKLQLDELMDRLVIDAADTKVNATLKAYESLTKALEERGILFEVAN